MSHDPLAMIEYRSDPAFFIWGDSQEAVARWRDAAESAGVAVRGTSETLAADVELPVASIPLLVEIEGDARWEVLDRLRAEAEAGRRFALSASLAAMDDEAVWHPNIIPSCQPTAMERLQAIALLVTPPAARLHDVGRDSHDMLRKLSEDVGRIAENWPASPKSRRAFAAKARTRRWTQRRSAP